MAFICTASGHPVGEATGLCAYVRRGTSPLDLYDRNEKGGKEREKGRKKPKDLTGVVSGKEKR